MTFYPFLGFKCLVFFLTDNEENHYNLEDNRRRKEMPKSTRADLRTAVRDLVEIRKVSDPSLHYRLSDVIGRLYDIHESLEIREYDKINWFKWDCQIGRTFAWQRYLIPKRLTLKSNPPVYRWLFFFFGPHTS